MSLNAAAVRLLAEKGLTALDIAEIMEAMEAKPRALTGAERAQRHRDKVNAERNENNVTSVTGTPSPSPSPSFPPDPQTNPTPAHTPVGDTARARKARFVLPSHLPAEKWEAYEEMRRRIRKPMTDRARALAVQKLDELAAAGWPPGDVLDQSVMNSWQGLFAIKEGRNGRSGQNGGGDIDRRGAIARVLDREIAEHYGQAERQGSGGNGASGGAPRPRLASM